MQKPFLNGCRGRVQGIAATGRVVVQLESQAVRASEGPEQEPDGGLLEAAAALACAFLGVCMFLGGVSVVGSVQLAA